MRTRRCAPAMTTRPRDCTLSQIFIKIGCRHVAMEADLLIRIMTTPASIQLRQGLGAPTVSPPTLKPPTEIRIPSLPQRNQIPSAAVAP